MIKIRLKPRFCKKPWRFNTLLRNRRVALGIKESEIEERLGIPIPTYDAYEMRLEIPSPERANKIAGMFKCETGEIFPLHLREYVRNLSEIERVMRQRYKPERYIRLSSNLDDFEVELGRLGGNAIADEEGPCFRDLSKGLKILNARGRKILLMRSGLYRPKGYVYTLEEIGVKLNITRERVRQLELKAVKDLKEILAKLDSDYI